MAMARRGQQKRTLWAGFAFVLGSVALHAGCGGDDENGGNAGSGGAGATSGSGGSGATGGAGTGGNGGAAGSGTNFFNWGVETTKVNYGSTPGQYDVQYKSNSHQDCTVAHSGSCSMRLDIIGDDSGNQSAGVDTIQWNPPYPFTMVGGAAVYYRWWMRIEPGFSWGSATAKTKSSRCFAGPEGTGLPGYTGYVTADGVLLGECGDDPSQCADNTGASNASDSGIGISYDFRSANDGGWHEYIVKVKPNSSAACVAGVDCDGQLQLWVDGTSVGEYNDFKISNAQTSEPMVEAWGGWMVSPYFQLNATTSDGGTLYLDDFSTDDTYHSLITP